MDESLRNQQTSWDENVSTAFRNARTGNVLSEHPDTRSLKAKFHSCITLLKNIVDDMVEWIKEIARAERYLNKLVLKLDHKLVRLEIWGADVGLDDPSLGTSSLEADVELELTRYVITVLDDLILELKGIKRTTQELRNVIEKLTVDGDEVMYVWTRLV